MDDGSRPPGQGRKAGFWHTISAVLWGFFGVRRGSAYREEDVRLNPVHVIIAGLIAAVLFVLVLVFIVRLVAG